MDKNEFLKACEKYTDGKPFINEEDFMTVVYVYNWHPSISGTCGKNQIAMLYSTFGMKIICDMIPRAQKMEMLDIVLRKANAKVEEIENKIKDELNT